MIPLNTRLSSTLSLPRGRGGKGRRTSISSSVNQTAVFFVSYHSSVPHVGFCCSQNCKNWASYWITEQSQVTIIFIFHPNFLMKSDPKWTGRRSRRSDPYSNPSVWVPSTKIPNNYNAGRQFITLLCVRLTITWTGCLNSSNKKIYKIRY